MARGSAYIPPRDTRCSSWPTKNPTGIFECKAPNSYPWESSRRAEPREHRGSRSTHTSPARSADKQCVHGSTNRRPRPKRSIRARQRFAMCLISIDSPYSAGRSPADYRLINVTAWIACAPMKRSSREFTRSARRSGKASPNRFREPDRGRGPGEKCDPDHDVGNALQEREVGRERQTSAREREHAERKHEAP